MQELCKQGLPLEVEKRNEAVLTSISPLFSAAVALGVAHMPLRTPVEAHAGCIPRLADLVQKYNSAVNPPSEAECTDHILSDVMHTANIIKSLLRENLADLQVLQLTDNFDEEFSHVDEYFFMYVLLYRYIYRFRDEMFNGLFCICLCLFC